eukprot:g14007.t1
MCEVETPLCYPVAAKLTPAVMYRYCDKLSTNGEDRSPEAKGCHDSYTPYVQRSLANKMFSHCGACRTEHHQDTVAYSWNEAEKCWHRGSGCLGHPEQKLATERKKDFCEDQKLLLELCLLILSETLMLSYCNDLGKTEDRTPHAKSCDSALSGQVHKALANKMFSHCGAWCIFDFDEPDKVAFGWNPQGKCWKKSDSCGPQLERDTISLLWPGLALKLESLESGPTIAIPCETSYLHHKNELMMSYCGALIVEGIDKSINAKGCEEVHTPQVQMALANKMFTGCASPCIFDFMMPHLAAFQWDKIHFCWKKIERCGATGEQDAVVARKRSVCEAPAGPCLPVYPTLTDELVSKHCARHATMLDMLPS